MSEHTTPGCAVIGPLLYLTVTVETEAGGVGGVHLHPGGQGFWIARMLQVLGCDERLISPIGGEAGTVLAALLPDWDIDFHAVCTSISSPTQVHDRRSGERVELVAVETPQLNRHEADDLYGAALEAGLRCGAVVLTSAGDTMLPDEAYARLVKDLNANGTRVFCDLHGEALAAALEGGELEALKVSEDDLIADGWEMGSEPQAIEAARELVARGAHTVVVSRAESPAVACIGGRVVRVTPPTVAEVDHRGAGDSMTAGVVVGHLRGFDEIDAVRLGAAAGAGNVTRHGLGSGDPDLIAELAELVEIEDLP
jgi:1-phosphofructokinase